jgi:hypothetical protein
MPVNKKSKSKLSKRNEHPDRLQRKGVCMMCGAFTHVSTIEEFDNQLLCDACRDDTAHLSKYLQSGQNPVSGLEDDLIDDDPLP